MSNKIGYIGLSSNDSKSNSLVPPFTIYDAPELALLQALARVGSCELGEMRVIHSDRSLQELADAVDSVKQRALRALQWRKLAFFVLHANPLFLSHHYDQSELTKFVCAEAFWQDLHVYADTEAVGGDPIVYQINTRYLLKDMRYGIAGFFGIHIPDKILNAPNANGFEDGLILFDSCREYTGKIDMNTSYLERVYGPNPIGANLFWDTVTRLKAID